MLDHFARLAANAGQTSMAVIGMLRHRLASRSLDLTFGLSLPIPNPKLLFEEFLGHWDSLVTIPDVQEDARVAGWALIRCLPEVRFLVFQPVLSPGNKPIGFILLLDSQVRTELTIAQRDAVELVANALTTDRRREQRQRHLMHVADRALRADRILRLVSEAPSCAAALTSLLEELCLFHSAAVGRIWQLTMPSDRLREISRYHATAALGAFFDAAPALPITTQNSMTARSIQSNIPHAIVYAEVERPEELALLEPARACGLTCQVSMPIWVQQQRFSIALAFTTVRHDLHSVMTDIGSLANTIRPTLFRKVAEEHIRFVAHHDDLTQLANRIEFNERLSDAIFHARQGDTGLALIYLDLDGFKMVNDAQGHEAGDKLLAAFAARLRDNTREGDIVARMGGDEFAIIQRVDGQPLPATALAQRLLETVEQPFYIDGQRAQVGVSIGISVYPMNGDTPDLLLRNADTAMYRAKEAGRNTFRLFDPAMAATRQQRLVVEQDLRTAIEEKQFTLAYQPICDTDSLQLRGFEALLRWNHPTRGQVQPAEFVYLAERTGLIMPLGHWVLKEACAEAAGWNPACFISVNLSPRQFRQPDFPEQIAEILARSGMQPERLDLEVTEGLLLDSSGLVLRNMRALREQGISITLDDFGTAYASLAYLRRFPFDQIKIDKSFIQGMCSDQHTLAIVRAILSLARELDLTVIAEGVETPQELDMLRDLGCRLIQGFLPGRPMPRQQARLLPGVAAQTHDGTGSHQTVAFTPTPP